MASLVLRSRVDRTRILAAWSGSSSRSAMRPKSASPSTSPWYAFTQSSSSGSSGEKIGEGTGGLSASVPVSLTSPTILPDRAGHTWCPWASAAPVASRRAPSLACARTMATVLLPIPALDFDPTEVAVTWQTLRSAGHVVVFATPSGQVGRGRRPDGDRARARSVGRDPARAQPDGGRPRPARRRRGAAGVHRAAQRRGLPHPAALGRGAAQFVRRARCCPAGTGPGACGPISRAPRCSRSPSTRSAPASRSAPSATACSWPPAPSTRRPAALCCTAGARPR